TGIPLNQTVYARIWAKVGGLWRSSDSSFTLATLYATIINPANGATDVDRAVPMTWTSVPNVQAYYLNIGTTLGGADLIDSGETLETSYPLNGLPANRTLYVRLSTEIYGEWRHVDTTFTAGVLAAQLTAPADGAVGVGTSPTFQWTTGIGGQAYRLYLGTTQGASDVLDTGELNTLTYAASNLPAAGLLYARLWTKVN